MNHSGIRKFNEDKWSNLLHQHETTPCGAGMCVRKIVANKYVEVIEGAKSYRRFEDKLSRRQRLNRNKIKGSKNYKKAQCQIARLHKKVANIPYWARKSVEN